MSVERFSELCDIPLLNWEKCLAGRFMFIREQRSKEYNNDDIKAFYELYNKYMERYGLSEQHRKYIEAQIRKSELICQYVEADVPDDFLLNYIAIEEGKIQQLNPANQKGMSIGQVVTMLSKWQGSWISKKDITVEEYKDLLELYERENKQE